MAMNSTLDRSNVDLEVVIAERVVLRRIENLEKGGGWIALKPRADLVDLVQHEHGVHRARLLQGLDDASRNRPDVGAPVPTDFSLVAHASQRDPHELPVHGPGDGLAERCLADARGPTKHRIGPLRDSDPLRRAFNFWTARYSTMRSLTLSRS